MSEFVCAACRHIYEKRNDEEWNDFKAAQEFLDLTPEAKNDPTDMVCDDCYEEFTRWFATLTESDKKKMRDDYFKGEK